MKRMLCIAVVLLVSMSGLLVGCEASVQSTILDGLQSGTTTITSALIAAGFQSLSNNNTSNASTL